jgi:thiol-disulfide isomerase/thioredoxin
VTSVNSPLNRARVRAPEFPAGTWFNTDAPLSLATLRGKIFLLDFWTFCCGNCLHVIDELRALEQDFADELVIVGVHSPKFEHEKSDAAVRAATERYEVAHPVLNDPALYLWRQYAVRAWPTLVLIDPNGYVVAQAAGEGQVSALRRMISALIAEHDADGTLRRGDNPYIAPVAVPNELRFPAKAIRVGDALYIADAGHHQIVRTGLDGATVEARIGSGIRGAGPDQLNEPNGVAVLPPELAATLGYDLIVADTGNHVLRGVNSATGTLIATVDLPAELAGTSTITGPIPDVLSPWDVIWWPEGGRSADTGDGTGDGMGDGDGDGSGARQGVVAVAAAGVHLILGWDPVTDVVRVLAGTTVEGLRDGPATDGWLAQPSGLAVDGDRLWFADSETSALRYLTADGYLHTAVGEGLFDFGHVDGAATDARMQHPLGVLVLPDGSVAVADTYNGAIRRYDPDTNSVSTLAGDLQEPSGLVLVDEEIVVVESNAHRLTRPITAGQLHQVLGARMQTERPITELAPGPVTLTVSFTPGPGRKLDDRYGPSTRLVISGTPDTLLSQGSGETTDLSRKLVLTADPGTEAVLQVIAQAASCDDDPEAEHPACYLARQDWGIPVRITRGGARELTLPLLG